MATSGARIILGQAINGPADGNGLTTKSGTKVQDVTLSGLSIQPASNHAGECVLVDFADNTLIEHVHDRSVRQQRQHGDHRRQDQLGAVAYIDKCQINVNACASGCADRALR
jgi:hypothetical protein